MNVLSRICIAVPLVLVLLNVPVSQVSRATKNQSKPLLGFHIARGDSLHMKAARAAGGEFTVHVFKWADIEPVSGYFYWEVPDAAMRAADFYGLEMIARIDHPPEWALDDESVTPWDLRAYENFVRRVISRYGDALGGVIIANEPNLGLEWHNKRPDPAAYVTLLQTAYGAVKEISPDLPVLMAGLAFTEGDAANVNDLAFLRQSYAAGARESFDVLAVHPYGFGQPPAQRPAENRLNFRRLELHRSLMVEHDDGHKPVWITEMGWRTSAPNPADAWQVVSPRQQADYVEEALDIVASNYPWLERVSLWQLDSAGDSYGYDLWNGATSVSRAYRRLVTLCIQQSKSCVSTANNELPIEISDRTTIPILASDVTIRLGDRGTLHPHWVHLHRGGENFSPHWRGEFFLSSKKSAGSYDLFIETMQIDQPTNRLEINGHDIANLLPRTRPDPTSTWITQRYRVHAGSLRAGANTIKISTGLRSPAWQYDYWRWENMQFRHARLVPSAEPPLALFSQWTRIASPGGWSDSIRLRNGLNDEYWLVGNRRGEIWRGSVEEPDLTNLAANFAHQLFTDVLPTSRGELAATERGLLWRRSGSSEWRTVSGLPQAYSYFVIKAGANYYTGFEDGGLWSATSPQGPWRQHSFEGLPLLDAVYSPADRILYVATPDGIYWQINGSDSWQRLPDFPDSDRHNADRKEITPFTNRLFLSTAEEVIARYQDRIWTWHDGDDSWTLIAPSILETDALFYSTLDCCGIGSIQAGPSGLWQLGAVGDWQRIDADQTLSAIGGEITDLLRMEEHLYAAGVTGLFRSDNGGRTWHKVAGLPSIVSDMIIDSRDNKHWLAATASGVYRSEDGGINWIATSPPWRVLDMSLSADGRLYLARTRGIAWSDSWDAETIQWWEAEGYDRVYFFNVSPQPDRPESLWAGTWGNDIGVSENGGETIEPLGNGLETLSVLDILWHATPGQITVGTAEGMFRSDNDGASWFKLPGPLTRQTVYDLQQTSDGMIWAAASNGLWLSRDYGAKWLRADGIPPVAVVRTGVVTQTEGTQWLWAGTEADGLWLSRDDGLTWQFAGLENRGVFHLLIDRADQERLIAATTEGVYAMVIRQRKATNIIGK